MQLSKVPKPNEGSPITQSGARTNQNTNARHPILIKTVDSKVCTEALSTVDTRLVQAVCRRLYSSWKKHVAAKTSTQFRTNLKKGICATLHMFHSEGLNSYVERQENKMRTLFKIFCPVFGVSSTALSVTRYNDEYKMYQLI